MKFVTQKIYDCELISLFAFVITKKQVSLFLFKREFRIWFGNNHAQGGQNVESNSEG